MELVLQSETLPLRRDASGARRIRRSPVLLELVIRAFQDGATPEVIAQRLPQCPRSCSYAQPLPSRYASLWEPRRFLRARTRTGRLTK